MTELEQQIEHLENTHTARIDKLKQLIAKANKDRVDLEAELRQEEQELNILLEQKARLLVSE